MRSCCHCPRFQIPPASFVCGMYEPERASLKESLRSLKEYKCMVTDREGELIQLLCSLRSPSSGRA